MISRYPISIVVTPSDLQESLFAAAEPGIAVLDTSTISVHVEFCDGHYWEGFGETALEDAKEVIRWLQAWPPKPEENHDTEASEEYLAHLTYPLSNPCPVDFGCLPQHAHIEC